MQVSVACKELKDQPVQPDQLGLKAIPVTLALLDRLAQLALPVPKAYLVRLALLGQQDQLVQKATQVKLAQPDPKDQPAQLGQPDPQDQLVQIQQCQDQQGQQDQPDPQVPPAHRE
jgi:hypothetical protein